MSSTYLCSWPDLRWLVRSTADDNHETTLVVPELLLPSVRYARLLVDEGAAFREHAVVLSESAAPDPTGVIVRALSAARPTRVTFLRLAVGASDPSIEGAEVSPSQVAASACVWLVESAPEQLRSNVLEESERQIRFAAGASSGEVWIRRTGQMFEVRC